MNRPISTPVLVGFGLAFAVVLLNGVISARNTFTLRENEMRVARSHGMLNALAGILSTLQDAETGQRGFVITGAERYLQPYEYAVASRAEIQEALARPEMQRYATGPLKRLRAAIDAKFDELDQVLEVRRERGFEAARSVILDDRGREAMRQIRDAIAEIRAGETEVLQARDEDSRRSYLTALVSGFGVLALCLVITGVAFLLVRRELNRRQQAEDQVRRAAAELEGRVRERTAELTATNAALERSNRELELFASVASHDLQEPLRKIQAFGDRLAQKFSDGLGEQGRDYVSRMQNAAGRMRTLINDLLNFSRVATKARPFERVDLNGVARQVVSDLEGLLRDVGGRVDVGALPAVDADPTQMGQLLQNLVGNALKFRKPGEPPVVEVRGRVVPGDRPACELTVADNGIGFEPVYAERIFGLFQRLHGRGQYDGNGIGLAICRKIVERHGGSIHAGSTPGAGSVFTVTLPVSQNGREEDHGARPREADHHPDGRR